MGKSRTVNTGTEVLVLSTRSWPSMGPRKEDLRCTGLGNPWTYNNFGHAIVDSGLINRRWVRDPEWSDPLVVEDK